MIIFYDLETKEITRTEENTMEPVLPFNMTYDEKKNFYKDNNEGFISIPQELGIYIFDYDLQFDEKENFIGLKPKALEKI